MWPFLILATAFPKLRLKSTTSNLKIVYVEFPSEKLCGSTMGKVPRTEEEALNFEWSYHRKKIPTTDFFIVSLKKSICFVPDNRLRTLYSHSYDNPQRYAFDRLKGLYRTKMNHQNHLVIHSSNSFGYSLVRAVTHKNLSSCKITWLTADQLKIRKIQSALEFQI